MIFNTFQLKVDEQDHQKNLDKLLKHIKSAPKHSFSLASELALTGFSYENFEDAMNFSKEALEQIKQFSTSKFISLTFLEKRGSHFFNTAKIIHNGEVLHSQDKYRLFPLGGEMSHFTNGAIDKVRLVEIDGLKVGVLICFEIRFTKLWERLKGADVILVPALWGKPRKEHLETLAKALALTNQCFVVVSNSSSSEYAKSSSIITPFGKIYKDDRKEVVTHQIDLKEIKKMKHYIRLHH